MNISSAIIRHENVSFTKFPSINISFNTFTCDKEVKIVFLISKTALLNSNNLYNKNIK